MRQLASLCEQLLQVVGWHEAVDHCSDGRDGCHLSSGQLLLRDPGERLFKKLQRRSEWTHFAAASFAPCSTLSEVAMRKDAEPDWGAVLKTKTMLRRGRSATRRLTMRKAIFAALAVLGFSLAATALAPTANASKTYLYQANQNNDGG